MKTARRIGFLLSAILCISALVEVCYAAGNGGGGGGRGGGGAGGGGRGGGGAGGGGAGGGGRGAGGRGGQGGQGQNSAGNAGPKFKELSVNSSFYFPSDDAKTYRWIKISSTTASNTVNQAVAPVAEDTVIKR